MIRLFRQGENHMKKLLLILSTTALLVASAGAHCQIPCGIYDDAARIKEMKEHVTTIEKSMKEIKRIGKEKSPDYNQLVRWVTNKESHADKLSKIVTSYFMAQRIKPVPEDKKADHVKYIEKLTLLHRILVLSMKAKQTRDMEQCA